MLRIALLMGTNVAVMVVLGLVMSILANVFGINLAGNGQLLVYSAVIGFVGALISLFLSKSMAKRSMGVRIIENPSTDDEVWFVRTVQQQAQAAGIAMPEVGIFDSASPNAFATGWNKNKALVAASTGLLHVMDRDEVEAVMAHEISHVANGDMVTMTLIQGVVNTFVFFFATIIGRFVDRAVFKNESGHGFAFYAVRALAQMLLGILASMIVMWFSRWREFRADSGAAKIAGSEKMIAALKKLQASHEPADMPAEMAAFGINSRALNKLRSSHPPLEDRIKALEKLG